MNWRLFLIILAVILVITSIIGCVILAVDESKIEKYTATGRVANELDRRRAMKEALKTVCKMKGYAWFQGADEFVFDCKYTKDTCLRDSVYPTKEGEYPSYYEWREYGTQDAIDAGYHGVQSNNDKTKMLSASFGLSSNMTREIDINNEELGGVCIMGNEYFRKMCEDEGGRYNPADGNCYTTAQYCLNKGGLPFCYGDCYEDPATQVFQGVLGNTVGTGISQIWNRGVADACKNAKAPDGHSQDQEM